MILDLDFDAAVVGEIGAFEAVGGIGRVRAGDEPLGMLDDPGRIDAHVVGHHVTGQADAVMIAAVAQGDVGRFAAKIVGNAIVEERIGRGDGILIAAELLDGLGGAAALPNADEPERIDAAVREVGEIFVGDLVEAADVAAVFAAQLRQPHIGAFGDEHRAGHPGRVGRELFVFVRGIVKTGTSAEADDQASAAGRRRRALGGCAGVAAGRVELHPDGQFFFAQDFAGDQQISLSRLVADQGLPELADERQVDRSASPASAGRRAQQIEQADGLGIRLRESAGGVAK